MTAITATHIASVQPPLAEVPLITFRDHCAEVRTALDNLVAQISAVQERLKVPPGTEKGKVGPLQAVLNQALREKEDELADQARAAREAYRNLDQRKSGMKVNSAESAEFCRTLDAYSRLLRTFQRTLDV